MAKSNVITVTSVGLLTFALFWTLNADNGRDMNDLVVQYMEALIKQMEKADAGT